MNNILADLYDNLSCVVQVIKIFQNAHVPK